MLLFSVHNMLFFLSLFLLFALLFAAVIRTFPHCWIHKCVLFYSILFSVYFLRGSAVFPVTCFIINALNPADCLSKSALSTVKPKSTVFNQQNCFCFSNICFKRFKKKKKNFKDSTTVVRFKNYVFPESCLIIHRSVRRAKCLEETRCLAGKWSNSPTCRQNGDS